MRAIFAFALLLSCLAEMMMAGLEAQTVQVIDKCLSEYGVTKQEVDKIKFDHIDPDNVSDNVKCAAHCILSKMNLMDGNGKLQQDKIVASAPNDTVRDQMREALNACANVVGADTCDSSYRMMDCFTEKVGSLLDM